MIIKWSEDYANGVEPFDDQHKRLFEMINVLYQGIKAKKTKESMSEVLDELVDYTVTHFTAEESAMKLKGYPKYDEHKKLHDEFTSKVKEFHSSFNAGESVLTLDVMGFISDWLIHHIGQSDKAYAPFLKG